MSQILNVGVRHEGQFIFSVYSRWGGFSASAAHMVWEFFHKVVKNASSDDELLLQAIRYFEEQSLANSIKASAPEARENIDNWLTESAGPDDMSGILKDFLNEHGGIAGEDLEYAQKKFNCEFQPATGSDNVVYIHQPSNEYNVIIDLDAKEIDFGILLVQEKDELFDEGVDVNKIPAVDFALDNISFADIDKWHETICSAHDMLCLGGLVYTLIA